MVDLDFIEHVYMMLVLLDDLGLDMLWLMELNTCMAQNGVGKVWILSIGWLEKFIPSGTSENPKLGKNPSLGTYLMNVF